MNKLQLLRRIMETMEPEMIQLGFKKSFSRQKFLRQKDKDFTIAYSLSVYDKFNMIKKRSGIVVEPSLYVHYSPIEKIYSKFTTRSLTSVTDLVTIGNLLSDIIANPSGKYIVHNESLGLFNYSESDFLTNANSLIRYFEDFALPYFEKYATIEGLDKIFNYHLEEASVHCYNNEPERSIRGIIAAKLFNNKNIQLLLKKHSEKIKTVWNENYQIEFSKLLEVLPTIKPII